MAFNLRAITAMLMVSLAMDNHCPESSNALPGPPVPGGVTGPRAVLTRTAL